MKVSLNWLRKYVDVPAPVEELEHIFSAAGLAVESVSKRGGNFAGVVVAQILDSQPHPNADRLSVCQVNDGSGTSRQIVCGAKNYKVGDKVPLALPGAELPGGLRIKVGRLRGVESQGMMCSARELELAEDAEGLLILPAHAEVGAPLDRLFPPDVVFGLEVTPNRPDWLGHVGVARELAAFTGARFQSPEPPVLEFPESEEAVVEAPDACPLYTLIRLGGAQVGASPDWLARDLQAVGLRPINVAVDITNWVMMETGQPLHVFDAAKVRGRVCVRWARAGEKLAGLDGRIYEFCGEELLIADEAGPLALAGVVGGEASGVDFSTREILLESAVFDAGLIRRTARKHGAATDSSYRFERGVDPFGTLLAARRAAALLRELAGAELVGAPCRVGRVPTLPAPVELRASRCRMVLGAEIEEAEMRRALEAFGLRVVSGGWQPPSHRRDLAREADLIEEVARYLGMERIPGRVVANPAPASAADRLHDFTASLKNRLAGLGFSEARSSVLVSQKAVGEKAVALRNPLGADQAYLRSSLLPGLLEALQRNLHAGAQTVALFETGKVFQAEEPEERHVLGILMHGHSAAASWRENEPRPLDFHDLKGLVETVMGGVTFHTAEPQGMLGVRMEVRFEGRALGEIGQLVPALARELDARGPVLLGELALDPRLAGGIRRYEPISPFPASRRDIAIVLPAAMLYEKIAEVIEEANEPLLSSFSPINIFQDRTGEKLPAECKSVAVALTFASPERTLTSEEVTQATERIKATLRSRLGVSFRE